MSRLKYSALTYILETVKRERERERERERAVAFLCIKSVWMYCFLILNQRSENSPFLLELGKSVIHEINLFLLAALLSQAFVLE